MANVEEDYSCLILFLSVRFFLSKSDITIDEETMATYSTPGNVISVLVLLAVFFVTTLTIMVKNKGEQVGWNLEAVLHKGAWTFVSAIVSILTVLSIVLCGFVGLFALIYLMRPLLPSQVHQQTLYCLSHPTDWWSGPWLHFKFILDRQGENCLRAASAIATCAGLLATAATILLTRLFTKNVEIVKTIHWCHKEYHQIVRPASKSEFDVVQLADFYRCEFHFHVRGLLPTNVYVAWLRSWLSRCSTHKEGFKAAFQEAVAHIDDPEFSALCDELCGEAYKHPSWQKVRDEILAARKKWQLARYGRLLSMLIRFIDSDHRSGTTGHPGVSS